MNNWKGKGKVKCGKKQQRKKENKEVALIARISGIILMIYTWSIRVCRAMYFILK
jgi:hypothetical protein